eukprot:TRINITY_DN22279_c0_g1_i1.p1 TRINITY_DN22279_c0_g1~~TRINITY_DN22279_c0_g1_i1.p1  ORF type:complete len:498 (+),score=114.60 TRINITY_DN22279_c0_g1_i1:99-1592(+)
MAGPSGPDVMALVGAAMYDEGSAASSTTAPATTTLGPTRHLDRQLDYQVAIIVGFVLLATGIGAELDRRWRKRQTPGSPRMWAYALLIASYGLLIPGLTLCLYDFKVTLSFFGITQPIREGNETVLQLIRDLYNNNLIFAAGMIMFYAIIIPAAKVLMLIVGQCWFHSESRTKVSIARFCIGTVQKVSKWASPDMFAYILMMYLFRAVDNPPSVQSNMQMDTGFTCFCIFCVGSTVSSLGLRTPAKAPLERVGAKQRKLRARRTALAVSLLTGAFAVLFCIGVSNPCMALKMDMDLLYQQRKELLAFKAVLDTLHLERLLHAEVSVWECLGSLGRWFFEGDWNSGIAFIMYGVFVMLFSVLDMAALCSAALSMAQGRSMTAVARRSMRVTKVLRKLAMLDVSVMGVLVIVLSMQDLRERGILVVVRWGIFMLLAAEVCHYFTIFMVDSVYDIVSDEFTSVGGGSGSESASSDDSDEEAGAIRSGGSNRGKHHSDAQE